jgi:outer membrane protein assembly factor BamB
MSVLEIRRRSGKTETRKLSKQAPVLVGQLESNDIRIEGDDIPPIHCRISWNRKAYEVTAATAEGVEWNGTTVKNAPLAPGDVLLVGNVEIVMQAEGAPAPGGRGSSGVRDKRSASPRSGDDLALKSSDDDLPARSSRGRDDADEEDDGMTDYGLSTDGLPAVSSPPAIERSGRGRDSDDDLDEPAGREPSRRPGAAGSKGPGLAARAAEISRSLKGPRLRPGEQEVLRSPLVIVLGVGTLVLLLAAASIWFFLSREAAQREFDAAKALVNAGQYGPGIEAFEQFLHNRPRHRLVDEAKLTIATAKVEQSLSSTNPAYDAALEALNGFINQYRETKAFQDVHSEVRKFVIEKSFDVAMGAAESARKERKRPPLKFSEEGGKLFMLYSPAETAPAIRLEEVNRTVRAAEAAILQQEAFDGVVKKMDDALAAGAPLSALPEYRRLLDRYSVAAEYRLLSERLKKSLDLERSRVEKDESRREANREERVWPLTGRPWTPARRQRVRSDITTVGATTFVTAEDCVYGVDTATGATLWRCVVGLDLPFQPLPVAAGVPALLSYDTQNREMVLMQQRTGDLIWRLPFADRPLGAPLIHEGQLLLATADGRLEQVDLQSGGSTGRLKFSQGIVGPPVVSPSGERLYIPGHAHVLYVLTRRPLACEQVVWLGHGPGAIIAPPLMLRNYLLVVENDRGDQAQLRMFGAAREDQPPRQIAQKRIEGHVRDNLAIRGKQLVVPSSPERVSAFTVAETNDEQSLTFIASYQAKESTGGPLFISIGQDDQLWVASSAVRRLTISRDSLLPDKQEAAIGIASQPMQIAGDSLFVARRLPYSRAVLFQEIERVRMSAQWKTSLGASILECTAPSSDGATLCLTTLGEMYQLSEERIARGGFELQALGQIADPETMTEPLSATRLADGRLAVYSGGAEPKLWLTRGDGSVRESKPQAALQADPILFGAGLLLPLPGRLRLVGADGGAPIAEDLPAQVSESASPHWRSVVALDNAVGLALNSQGRLSRFQYRGAPVSHLAEITHWDAAAPVDQKMAVDRGRVLVVDSAGKLVMLDATTFEPLGDFQLDRPASRAPCPVGDQLLVEVGGTKLVCCDLTQRLARQWELPLDGGSVIGSPIGHGKRILIALADGRVLSVSPATGEVARTLNLGQRLAYGPQVWGKQVVVGALDGSLIAISSWLEQLP